MAMALPTEGNGLAANRSLARNIDSGTAGFRRGIGADAVTMGVACFSKLLAWVSPITMLSSITVKATSNDPDRATKRARIILPISDSTSKVYETGDNLNRVGPNGTAIPIMNKVKN